MAVLNRTAHIFEYLSAKSEGYRDRATGDWVDGKEEWVTNYCKCDIVPAGKANQITIPDGQVETYSYTIYSLPKSCREFKYGDKIRIKFFGSEDDVKEFTVKGFHRYQMQCKIWV
jgi:hypothetical protein